MCVCVCVCVLVFMVCITCMHHVANSHSGLVSFTDFSAFLFCLLTVGGQQDDSRLFQGALPTSLSSSKALRPCLAHVAAFPGMLAKHADSNLVHVHRKEEAQGVGGDEG